MSTASYHWNKDGSGKIEWRSLEELANIDIGMALAVAQMSQSSFAESYKPAITPEMVELQCQHNVAISRQIELLNYPQQPEEPIVTTLWKRLKRWFR